MLEQIRAVSLSPVKHLPLLLFTSHSSLLSACTRLRARRAVGAQLLRRHPCLAPSLLFSFSAAVDCTVHNCTGLQLSTISEKYTYATPSLIQGGTESHSWVALTWRRLAGWLLNSQHSSRFCLLLLLDRGQDWSLSASLEREHPTCYNHAVANTLSISLEKLEGCFKQLAWTRSFTTFELRLRMLWIVHLRSRTESWLPRAAP